MLGPGTFIRVIAIVPVEEEEDSPYDGLLQVEPA
jgi:hypothetical protein